MPHNVDIILNSLSVKKRNLYLYMLTYGYIQVNIFRKGIGRARKKPEEPKEAEEPEERLIHGGLQISDEYPGKLPALPA